MKKISWTLMFTCALVLVGALFFGCNQPLDTPDDPPSSGPKTPGNTPLEITGFRFPITSPSSSSGHTLVLKDDGTVWATGYNRYGEFGDGTKISSSPYTTTTFTQVADHVVSLGDTNSTNDSFIIKDDGYLWAAGRNNYENHTSETTTFAKEVSLGSGVKAVSVNQGIYVLKEDGSLWVRGKASANTHGELGAGHKNAVDDWTKVIDSGVVAIAKSGYFGLVLKSDGTVWGAGYNYFGALGQGPPFGQIPQQTWTELTSFTQIFEDAKAIAAGSSSHSLILKKDGTVWAAGGSSSGRLGNGVTANTSDTAQTSFAQIEGISGATAISAGNNHSLILTSDGTLWAAGDNANGQLGKPKNTPTVSADFIEIETGVTQISAQGDQTFIVKNDGTLYVTGYVNTGILGTARDKVYGFTLIPLPELPE
jgi:alpha-tubulin suppressor-like RCC1 family protein